MLDPTIGIVLASFLLVCILWKKLPLHPRTGKAKLLPPGPRRLPLLGNLFDIPTKSPWEVFSKWAGVYGARVPRRNTRILTSRARRRRRVPRGGRTSDSLVKLRPGHRGSFRKSFRAILRQTQVPVNGPVRIFRALSVHRGSHSPRSPQRRAPVELRSHELRQGLACSEENLQRKIHGHKGVAVLLLRTPRHDPSSTPKHSSCTRSFSRPLHAVSALQRVADVHRTYGT